MRISFPFILLAAICVTAVSVFLFPKPEQMGKALEQAGRLEEAVAYYKAALEAHPSDELPLVRLASLYMLRGEPDEAIATYQRLVELDPGDIGYRRQLAQLYDWSLRIDEAMVQNARIAELDRKEVLVRQELASYYVLERKDYAAATRLVEEIVGARPGDGEALFELAQLYSQTGRIADAVTTYQRAVEEDPSNPLIARGLARANAWARQFEDAVARHRAVLASDPNDVTALRSLRDLLRNVGQHAEAEQLDQRLRLAPQS
jgi:tetratricopeptide (TPR) repeat protein